MKPTHAPVAPLAAMAALSLALLAGCSIGSVEIPIPDDFLAPTSVAEAKAAQRSEVVPMVSSDDLVTVDTLTVGVPETIGAPFVITSTDGSTTGIDVDCAYAIADALGLTSVKFTSVVSVSAGVTGGTCDIVMGATSGEASELVTVVGNLSQSALGVFSKTVSAVPIDVSELAGKVIGVQAGSVSQTAIAEIAIEYTEATYSNLNEAFAALEQGTIEYVVCDAYSGAYLAASYADILFAGTLDEPVNVGVAVAAGSNIASAVQTAVETVQNNGVAAIAKTQWVGTLPTLTDSTKITGVVSAAETAGDADEVWFDENAGEMLEEEANE